MLRYLTAGESHGPALTAIVEGLPAGLPLTAAYINRQLARRQGGYGRGARMKIESDTVSFLSGVRGGLTLGSPLALLVENEDWANWSEIMSAEPGARTDERVVRRPRPGHADLAGALKYRIKTSETFWNEPAPGNRRQGAAAAGQEASGGTGNYHHRAGRPVGRLSAAVENLGLEELKAGLVHSRLNCADPAMEQRMLETIDAALAAGDTLGGVFEVRAYGVPAGLGSYTHWDRKLDGRLAAALMSIQAVKGVEVGLGFAAAGRRGSQVQDEIFYEPGRGFYRLNNRAGGIEGGVTNGETVVVRGAMKPIPTLNQPLQSVDMITRKPSRAAVERSDVCAVPAACVIGEALVAWELARACLEKCGGDSLEELKDNWNRHLSFLRKVRRKM